MEDPIKNVTNQEDEVLPVILSAEVQPLPKTMRTTLSVPKAITVNFAAQKEDARRKAVDENDGTASRPPKIAPSLVRAPKIGEIYWCDLPKDAHIPELWKRRSVVVISKTVTLHGTAVVLPTTTDSERISVHMREISCSLDHRTSYAICDKPMTLAVSRFYRADPVRIPKLPMEEVDDLIRALNKVIPAPASVDTDEDGGK
jgi:mRNA interferase MazF